MADYIQQNGNVLKIMNIQTTKDASTKAEIHDEVLVMRTLDGDDGAYAMLVQRYRNRIYNFCYRYLGDSGEAEDMAQEVFVKAHKNLAKFRGDSKFSTWLFQIAKNMSINKLRSLKRKFKQLWQPAVQGDDGDVYDPVAQIPSDERDSESTALGNEASVVVQQAIQKLTPVFRSALILRDIEEMSYEEIAEILGLAQGTVKSRIHRARLELKSLLASYVEAGHIQ